MYNGTPKSSNYSPKTGLTEFKILAVNPTKEEISEMLGRNYPLDVNYDLRDDLNGEKVRPIEFWVKSESTGIVDRVTFQIGNVTRKSQNNNVQVVNAKGIMRYAPSIEDANVKYQSMAPFVREVMIGEEALYRFMQCAIGYKPSLPDANFLGDNEAAGITKDALFNGDVQGLNKFIEFVNGKQRKIGLVLAVKEKEKQDDQGNKYTQNRQVILNQPDFFFTLASGKVGDYSKSKFEEVIQEKRSNNVTLGTALFTINLQDYVKEDCVNNVPTNPVKTTSTWA
jgi:hypothetical protein